MSKERKGRAEKLAEIARQNPTVIRDINEGLQAERDHGLIPLRELKRKPRRKKQ